MPEISIVLPVYNGEKYLQESIESVLSQTFTDWELILVDDCSTDGSLKIMEKYKSIDKRIRIVRNEANLKLPASLNEGFSIAEGRFLTWTSDDNLYLESALEEMYQYLHDYKDQMMVVADMKIFFEDGSKEQLFEANPDDLPIVNGIGACFLYRRQVLERVGNYDDTAFLVEDYDYWLRVFMAYGKIGSISKVLYRYRSHHNSLSSNNAMLVKQCVNRLRSKYVDSFIEWLKDRSEWAVRVYTELLEYGTDDVNTLNNYRNIIPLKYRGIEIVNKEKFVIYGSGNYGVRARKILGEKAYGFIDKDSSKVGSQIEGLEVYDVEKTMELADKYELLIAVSSEITSDVIDYLDGIGVKEFMLVQQLIHNHNGGCNS